MKVRFDPPVRRDADVVDGMRVHYAPSRRSVPRMRWYLLILAVASPLVYFLVSFIIDSVIVKARGIVAPPVFISIRAADDGVVEKLCVVPGARVRLGQELLYIAKDAAKAATPTEGTTAQERATAQALQGELERARLRVDFQRERMEKMKLLRESGAATAGEFEQAWGQWLSALDYQSRLEKEIAGLTALQPASRAATPGTITFESQETFGQGATSRQELQKHLYDGRRYLAPRKGEVLDIFARAGDRVTRGVALLSMSLSDEAEVTAYLDPRHVKYATEGHKAKIIFPDGAAVRGVVMGIEQAAARPPSDAPDPLGFRRLSLAVKVKAVDPLPPMREIGGLPVSVRFYSESYPRDPKTGEPIVK
jgi:multidrug resistance efflux pump